MIESTVADRARTHQAPPPPAPAAPKRRRDPRPADRLPGVVTLGLGLAWVVTLTVIFGLEPQPASPDGPTLLGFVVSMVLLYAIAGTVMGLAMGRRWGAMASLVGGVAILAGATMCMLDGHSGLWLTSQFAGGAALSALSRGAIKAT